MTKDLLRASEIRQTINTVGWRHIDKLFEMLVVGWEREALSIDDEARIIAAQREARVARKILEEFRSRVQIAGSADPEPQADESILVAM